MNTAEASTTTSDEDATTNTSVPIQAVIGASPGNRRRTEKISEVIAREIVQDVRGLRPGTMLPSEAKLLERYQVGRASLREALRVLEMQGLIVIRPGPGGGPMIVQADSERFGRMASLHYHMAGATYRDTLEARLILEPVVVASIAQRQAPEHIRALQDYLELSRTTILDSVTNPAPEDSLEDEEALEFHAMLMEMSGNPVMTLVTRSLQDLRVDRRSRPMFRHEDPEKVSGIHHLIARAIIDGHPAQASQLMHEHMREFLEFMLTHEPALLEQIVSWH